jgi:sterol desaturase/sphingolipid hydroxylase (fatty acid hydroxylase superfamily)
MQKKFVTNSEKSSRMFQSNLLEALSKVHFMIPIIIYVPLIIYWVYLSFERYNQTAIVISEYFLLGLFIWSLAEYTLHRFVFHYQPTSRTGKRLHFILHGVHHDYPSDKLRLVMPPSISLILALIFFLFFSIFLSDALLYPFFAGFVLGYLFYDITHYAIHHFNFKGKIWKKIKQHHMLHHYSDADKGYGVTSKIWDIAFKSNFK